MATVSEVPRLTGGAVYKYAYFQVVIGLLLLILLDFKKEKVFCVARNVFSA